VGHRRVVTGQVPAAVFLAATFLLASCISQKDETLPVPSLGTGVIKLKLAYVANPHFPSMTKEQKKLMLVAARLGLKEHFGRDAEFLEADEYPLQALVDRVPSKDWSEWNSRIYDFKSGTGDRRRLNRAYAEGLRDKGDNLDEMIAYAKPFLLAPISERSYEGFAQALTATLLARLEQLKSQKLSDASDVIDRSPNNEYVFWDRVGWLSFPYDVVVTNQLIASAEYIGPSVHSAIRGGITNGITTRNPLSRYGTTAIVSTYPFIGKDAVTTSLRDGESYSDTESATFAGLLLVHEMGHQLFHLGHPYGRRSCVMNPPELLHFRAWSRDLSPKGCPIGGPGAMKPGFEKFPLQEQFH
jgi:hypothetical protein